MGEHQVGAHFREGNPVRAHKRRSGSAGSDDAVPSTAIAAAVTAAAATSDTASHHEAERQARICDAQDKIAQAHSLVDEIDEAADDMDCSRCTPRCYCGDARHRIEVAVERMRSLLGELV